MADLWTKTKKLPKLAVDRTAKQLNEEVEKINKIMKQQTHKVEHFVSFIAACTALL